MPAPRPRPGPLRWLGYTFGTGLPPRFAPWVLHDTTSRTWWLRHFARLAVQMAPFVAAIIVFVPGPLSLRVMTAAAGAVMGAIYGIAYLHETTEHRLVKAGYPRGTGPAERAERVRDPEAEARYIARYRNTG
jgi:hypothetical protein